MKVVIDDGAFVPTRAHDLDAGYDLYAVEDAVVMAGSSYIFDTGVHMEIPKNHVGMVKSRSGLMNSGITSEGVIDSGFTGSIHLKLFNHGDRNIIIERGMKISQIVIMPIITPELEIVSSLEETERGSNGFGSTGVF